ncbi:MAG: phytanoyl-CoA dioxygenase family protein [Acidimicrobiales bacterium]
MDPIELRTPSGTRAYALHGDTVVEHPGADDAGTVVLLSDASWDDLRGQRRTIMHLHLNGELSFERGGFDHLAAWEPHLRRHHAGIPIYDPARVDLSGVDLARTFTLEDPDDELLAFYRAAGFLHVRGVFSPDEMAAANAEVDRLAAAARPGDDRSWWATDREGHERVCRLVYATQRSALLRGLEEDPRTRRLGTLAHPGHRVAPDRMEGSAVILKLPGRTKGLANIPWHQDCGMGGHAVFCPNTSVGIQLTGSSAATGNLAVVPGSHGQTLAYDWERRLHGVPVVHVDTDPGDVTLHVADVMHASPEPTGAGGRRTLYVTFYPPDLWDHVAAGEAYNDVVRNRTHEADAWRAGPAGSA